MIQRADDFLAFYSNGKDKDVLAHMGEGIVMANQTHPTGPDGVKWEFISVERSIAYHHAKAALDALRKAGFTISKNGNS